MPEMKDKWFVQNIIIRGKIREPSQIKYGGTYQQELMFVCCQWMREETTLSATAN